MPESTSNKSCDCKLKCLADIESIFSVLSLQNSLVSPLNVLLTGKMNKRTSLNFTCIY